MNEKQKDSCCESFCPSEPFTRENYYFGKLLTAQALRGEQQYLNEKRWLINRYGIGWGVLCGLTVIPDCENPCGVIVQPGMALDKYGNEILVCEPQRVDLKSACVKEKEKEKQEKGGIKQKECQTQKICISIRYKECPSNPSPIPVDKCGQFENKCEYNRTKETFTINVSCEESKKLPAKKDECESDCTRFLNDSSPFLIEECPPRSRHCEIILACICYTERTPVKEYHIDNITYRKLAFSNETLYAMIRCLSEEARQAKGDRHDRRQHIPLLANTIKGLSYRDGKIARIEGNTGKHPFRVTSDGDFIWLTDRESPELIRIDRKTNQLIEGKPIDLKCCDKSEDPVESSWGIAFDGKYMWITHNNEGAGKLTRINACQPEDCRTFSNLPYCSDLKECQKYCTEQSGNNLESLLPYPQEVVYHQGLLYVSHGAAPKPVPRQALHHQEAQDKSQEEQEETTALYISVIDTQRCCLLLTIPLELEKNCTLRGPISSMVSDGDALWIAYTASFPHYQKARNQPVVQKITYNRSTNKHDIGDPYPVDKGKRSGKLAFDGTHLWLTHDGGGSKIELTTGRVVSHIETDQEQVAIAYGGGDNIWTVEYNHGEARINRTDIHSVDRNGEIEFVSEFPGYFVTDAQFDGVFIYVSAYTNTDEASNQGVIYRILP